MDEEAIGLAVDAMYAMISGPAGPRDWSRQQEVFHPDCRQIRTGVDERGRSWKQAFTPAEYRVNADLLLAQMDFYEVEIRRETRVFGNIAHVWSAYEARAAPGDAVPERRGINSIQLYKGEDGLWRIIHMIWDNEREGVRLPGSILPVAPGSPG
ncbi:hypothetical protein [Pseudoxanthomonas wuyuanensis]